MNNIETAKALIEHGFAIVPLYSKLSSNIILLSLSYMTLL